MSAFHPLRTYRARRRVPIDGEEGKRCEGRLKKIAKAKPKKLQ